MGAHRMKEESVAEEKALGPEDRVTVRTSFRPDRDVEMSATEAEDLRRQGLLVQVDQELEEKPEARTRGRRTGEESN